MASPTIRDVARRAGVSAATVSRVHQRSAQVAGETRDRVEAAIAELDYTPSHLGQSLARRRHAALGIVLPDLSGPYFAEVLRGFEDEATSAAEAAIVLSTHGREALAERIRTLAARVDGLLVLGRTVPDETIEELLAAGRAVVLLARSPVPDADSVNAENRHAARRLTAHLLDHGHGRIAFVGDPDSSPDGAERLKGFQEAHEMAGLPSPELLVATSYREMEGYVAVEALLERGTGVTALFCANDEIALGAYAACAEAGLQIGSDVAITGWDDVPIARHVSPPLTTVRQPMYELGRRGAQILRERIAAGSSGASRAPIHDVLATQLVIRASCGCRPQQGGIRS
jgi:LacI family transcriptional regulator